MKVETKFLGKKDLCGIIFEEVGLFIDGKEIDKGQEFKVFYNGGGKYKGKNAKIALWYKKETIDVYIPTVYKSALETGNYRPGTSSGPQNRHWVKGYVKRGKLEEIINFTEFNDMSWCGDEWEVDNIEITPNNEILIERRNNRDPEKSGVITVKLSDYGIKIKKDLERNVLTAEEAKTLVKKIAPHLGYDYTYNPVFPETRKDVCAVRHMAEDGSTYGFDTIYLVWKDKEGKINHKKLTDSRSTKDYIHIEEVKEEKDKIIVRVRSGGSYSGHPWKKTIEIKKEEIGIK